MVVYIYILKCKSWIAQWVKALAMSARKTTVKLFFQLLYIMGTRTEEFTVYGLKSRRGTEIEMLFVKTDTNAGSTSEFGCYI